MMILIGSRSLRLPRIHFTQQSTQAAAKHPSGQCQCAWLAACAMPFSTAGLGRLGVKLSPPPHSPVPCFPPLPCFRFTLHTSHTALHCTALGVAVGHAGTRSSPPLRSALPPSHSQEETEERDGNATPFRFHWTEGEQERR